MQHTRQKTEGTFKGTFGKGAKLLNKINTPQNPTRDIQLFIEYKIIPLIRHLRF